MDEPCVMVAISQKAVKIQHRNFNPILKLSFSCNITQAP